jgi:transposase
VYGCQQNLISPDVELKAILEFICSEANSLINCGIYYVRQIYFKTKRIIGKYELEAEYKSNRHYKALYSQVAQQVLRSVVKSFNSFKGLNKLFKTGELETQPRPPKYRVSGGMALVTYPNQALKLVDGKIKIPLGNCNGAANIIRKVATTLGLCLEGVCRGALTTPLRVRIWTLKNHRTLGR